MNIESNGKHPAQNANNAPRKNKIHKCISQTSGTLKVPSNIHLFYIPPYTPEMNPIEQIWREIRTRGFKNEAFQTLADVIDRLCETIQGLSKETIRSITGRDWILSLF